MIALFVLATLLPYISAAWLLGGKRENDLSTDRRIFEVLILGTGLLYSILNVVVFGAALSIPAVAAIGSLTALAAWFFARQRERSAADANVSADIRQDPNPADRWTNRVSMLLVAVVSGVWLLQATAGLQISGADAGHYHIPHAVDFALGASPWGLRATPHTYPMGTSVLFAWFIVPFGDAFLIEAGTLVWYLVLVASVAAIFRELTGLSGWTWTPWFVLLLMSLPIVSGSAYPSSDLAYAASFLAVTAQLTWMVGRQLGSVRQWALLGLSLGLLVGCKTSGTYSAVLLLGAAGLIQAAWHRRVFWRPLRPVAVALLVVVGAGLFAGGIWLIRNTWMFGRPVEVVTDRYYQSVLSDLQTTYRGEWMYLLWRAKGKIEHWLGPYFLYAWVPILWLAIESVVLAVRRSSDALGRTRTWFLVLMTAVVAIHFAGLIGAPWTSLEWTGGQSLRYALPLWVLIAVIAYAALFSRWLRWHDEPVLRVIAWACLAAGTLWNVTGFAGLGSVTLNAGFWQTLLSTVAVVIVSWSVMGKPGLAVGVHSRARNALISIGMLAVAATAGSFWLESRHAPLRADAEAREGAELTDWSVGTKPAVDQAFRQVFLEVRTDETLRGEVCEARRFFVTSRFDAPMALQPARYTSLVFESRWDPERALQMLRHAVRGTCDYVVVNREEVSRRVLTNVGRPIQSAGEFLSYRVRLTPTR